MQVAQEIQARIPFYVDDWTTAFQSKHNFFRVLAATIYVFFTSVAPAVTFASFLTSNTDGQYGTIDVLLSTGLNGIFYSIFAGQPLIIVGVTGPVSIFLETLFRLNEQLFHTNFLALVFWIGLWACLIHVALGLFGACSIVQYVTPYTCEVFSAFIGCIYVYTALRQIVSVFANESVSSGLLVTVIAVLTLWICHCGSNARSWKAFSATIRGLACDYIVPVAVIFVTALYQIPVFRQVPIKLLPTPLVFGPSNGRSSFLVSPLDVSVPLVFAAFIPAVILTVLIFFDHNVSSLLAQQQIGVKLKKPSAYNWDFVLIGVLMALTGLFGLPFTHGLIPQAPLHIRALSLTKQQDGAVDENGTSTAQLLATTTVEQRVSNLVQSILTIFFCTISGLLVLLSSIPVAALNGLFLFMGLEAFTNNAFTARLYALLFVTDLETRSKMLFWPIGVNHAKIWFFVLTQFAMLVVIFAVTISPLAILFPLAITLTVCIRLSLSQTWFWDSIQMDKRDLLLLDGQALANEAEQVDMAMTELAFGYTHPET
ncbi:hypothetical protein HDU91_004912 [Kappamyces sp. JEL0680]|nr:hypothetical protein HDU91_004912 [Kappamyces sp. JEL0680]